MKEARINIEMDKTTGLAVPPENHYWEITYYHEGETIGPLVLQLWSKEVKTVLKYAPRSWWDKLINGGGGETKKVEQEENKLVYQKVLVPNSEVEDATDIKKNRRCLTLYIPTSTEVNDAMVADASRRIALSYALDRRNAERRKKVALNNNAYVGTYPPKRLGK